MVSTHKSAELEQEEDPTNFSASSAATTTAARQVFAAVVHGRLVELEFLPQAVNSGYEQTATTFVRQTHLQYPSFLSLEVQNFTGTLHLRLPSSSSSSTSRNGGEEHHPIPQNDLDPDIVVEITSRKKGEEDGDQQAAFVNNNNNNGAPWDEERGEATATKEREQDSAVSLEREQKANVNGNDSWPPFWQTPAQSASSWTSENKSADDDDDDDNNGNQPTNKSSGDSIWHSLPNVGSLIMKRQSSPAKTVKASSSSSAIVAATATGPSALSTRSRATMPSVVHAVRAARRLRNGSGGAAAAATSGLSLAPLPPPTRLHQLLSSGIGNNRSAATALSELEHFVIQPKDAATPDAEGRLPLHLLGDNDELISSSLEMASDGSGREEAVLSVFGVRLMQVHPEAITALDASGRMPFVRLVEDWVEWVQEMKRRQTKRRKKDMLTGILFYSGLETSEPQNNHSSMAAAASDAVSRSGGLGRASADSSVADAASAFSQAAKDSLASGITVHLVSSGVELWGEVEWCFTMLSKAIEILRECGSAPVANLLADDGGSDVLGPTQNTHHETQLRGEQACEQLLVHLLTRIPNLVKTVLALDKETMDRLLSSTVMKSVLFRPESVGAWLTKILQSGLPSSSARGVDYLVAVSMLKPQDRFGSERELSPGDQLTFSCEKERVFDAICDLDGMVVSLVVLDEVSLERALRTKIIRHIVSQKLSRPFVVSLVLIDLILHLTLMLAFRNSVTISNVSEGNFLGGIPIGVVLMICLYSLVRKACEALASWMFSYSVFKAYFVRNGWTIMDVLTVILVAVAIIWNINHPGEYRSGFNTFVMALLWIKVLGYLKIINKQMATFIMSLAHIVSGIRYFGVVLLIIIFMFGDMMHITISTQNNGEFCQTTEDLNDATADFCAPEQTKSYVRMQVKYALLLGDFELNNYRESPGMLVIFFLFTTIALIILLNVIIAVISEAFEKASIGSDLLYGKARLQFVAQNEALESFFRPTSSIPVSEESLEAMSKRTFVLAGRFLRWAAFLSLIAAAIMSDLYLGEQAYAIIKSLVTGESVRDSWISIAVCFLFVTTLSVALWIMLRIALRGLLVHCNPTLAENRFGDETGCTSRLNKKIANVMFGIGPTDIQTGAGEEPDEWNGRIAFLESQMERLIQKAKTDLEDDMEAMELRLNAKLQTLK